MKLTAIAIEKFRSIVEKQEIPIEQFTILIGRNNNGKSNILKALNLALGILKRADMEIRGLLGSSGFSAYPNPFKVDSNLKNEDSQKSLSDFVFVPRINDLYNWEKDFPRDLQNSHRIEHALVGESKVSSISRINNIFAYEANISLKLNFDEAEIEDLNDKTKNDLSPHLLVSVKVISSLNGYSFAWITVSDSEKKGNELSEALQKYIISFICYKINFYYIPTIRTADSVEDLFKVLVERELTQLEEQEKYRDALEIINSLEDEAAKDLAEEIKGHIKSFLPTITNCRIDILKYERMRKSVRESKLFIHDGVETELNNKGNGVQSLTAVALMLYEFKSRQKGKSVIIAFEEPESHLHPQAIQQVRKTLQTLSGEDQIIITTHNPIFTNRIDIKQNIIVHQNKAQGAKNIREVREVLGVRLDDNLMGAEIVLFVEGETDQIALTSILSGMNEKIKENIENGRFAIISLGTASNLKTRGQLYSGLLMVNKLFALLDSDTSGKNAYNATREEDFFPENTVFMTNVKGKKEAELEDLYREEITQGIIVKEIGEEWLKKSKNKDKKWSGRIRLLLQDQGKPNTEEVLKAIKRQVALEAASRGASALNKETSAPLENLVKHLLLALEEDESMKSMVIL